MRRLGTATMALLLLGGCWWSGPVLYPPDPVAGAPLTPGRYISRSDDRSHDEEQVTATRDLDGAWRLIGDKEPGDAMRAVFAPLGRNGWVMEALPDKARPGAVYAYAWRSGPLLTLHVMKCEGAEAMVVHAGGAVSGDAKNPECVFTDRGSLERALRAYLAANPKLGGTTLRRIGD